MMFLLKKESPILLSYVSITSDKVDVTRDINSGMFIPSAEVSVKKEIILTTHDYFIDSDQLGVEYDMRREMVTVRYLTTPRPRWNQYEVVQFEVPRETLKRVE